MKALSTSLVLPGRLWTEIRTNRDFVATLVAEMVPNGISERVFANNDALFFVVFAKRDCWEPVRCAG